MENEWLTKDWTTGKLNAVIKIIGAENAERLLRGEITVKFEEAIRMLFDRNGRRIPQGLKANVCDSNRDFRLVQPAMATLEDYTGRLKRLQDYLGIDTGITAEEFEREIKRQLALIQSDPQVANLAKGVCLPLILPKLEKANLGDILEQYLKALETSYFDNFPNRKFNNYRKGELKGKVSVVEAGRYDEVIKRMKQGTVVVIYFPDPLQGFSVNASIEQIETLPESFAVSGFEAVIAAIMYPDVLARDWHTPGLDLAALSWRSSDYSLCLEARDGYAGFGRRGSLSDAYGLYSAGVVFFG